MKRAFDLLVSSVGLLVLAPILASISILTLMFSGWPILFRQIRVGHRGKPFVMYKFRTMVRNAESLGRPLTVGNDPRITWFGKWLRNSKLDELPQLWNVFLGQMSLVGPRPEVDRYVALYSPSQRQVLNLVPGITDPASIRYRYESDLLQASADPERTYVDEIMPEKIRINLEYARCRSMLRDIAILLQTVIAIFRREQSPGEVTELPASPEDGNKKSISVVTPHVSVVIPCRNERASIESCLHSILDQIEPPGGFEVLVVDGMSDDGTREIIRRAAATDPRVRMLDNPRRITPVALNLGISSAQGQIIVRMDAHTRYAQDYIIRCVETLEQTGADNVGGPARTEASNYVQRAIAAAHHSPFSSGGAPFHYVDYEGEVDTVFYGCWRKEKLLGIGLFDEELVRNQDDELNYRIVQSGGRLWQSPNIRCWYSPRNSLAGLFKQYLQYGYWKVRVIQKHRRPASPRHLVPVVFVLGLTLGWLAGFVYPPLGFVYAAAILSYGAISVAFSVKSCSAEGWTILPILPLVFFIYHLSYGLGFAGGLINFYLIYRDRKRAAYPTMTLRTSDHRQAA